MPGLRGKVAVVKNFALFSVAGILACGILAGCKETTKPEAPKASVPQTGASTAQDKTGRPAKPGLTKLILKDTVLGKGAQSAKGDLVYVLYVGKLPDGKEFDGSERHDNEPLPFVVGTGNVIKGWDDGLLGMKVGGERDISIPTDLAYGAKGAGNVIPPNSDLFFHVKLVDIVRKGEESVVDIKDLKPGSGRAAKNGNTVTLHYVGTLLSGKKFDSSRDRKKPLTITLGTGEIVPGFNSGLLGMKVGGVRRIRIPPNVGYGAEGHGPVPANGIMIFEVEMLAIK